MLCYAKSSSRRHRAFVVYILLLKKREKNKHGNGRPCYFLADMELHRQDWEMQQGANRQHLPPETQQTLPAERQRAASGFSLPAVFSNFGFCRLEHAARTLSTAEKQSHWVEKLLVKLVKGSQSRLAARMALTQLSRAGPGRQEGRLTPLAAAGKHSTESQLNVLRLQHIFFFF